MSGLLLKDYYLLFQRKQTLFLFAAVSLLMGFSTDGSFVVGYMTFLGVVLSLSTISYDEGGSGMMYLLTLPVSRKTYADSKYALSGIFGVATWMVAVVLMLIINQVKGIPVNLREDLINALVVLPVACLMLDVMIPLQLKFGAEKSRIAMMLIAGAIAAIAALMSVVPGAAERLDTAVETLSGASVAVLTVAGLAVVAALTVVSMMVSRRIVEKKEF